MISANILNILLFLPLFGILIISFIPSNYSFFLKLISLVVAGCSFLISMLLWLQFDKSVGSFQMVSIITWIPFFNINMLLGIDGISLFFLILTNLLIFICLLASWENITDNVKFYLILFLCLQFFLNGVFSILDLLIFYIFLNVFLFLCFY